MDFRDVTRRAFLGPKTILKSISTPEQEFWFRPRKYSVEISAQLSEIQRGWIWEHRKDIRGMQELEEKLKAEETTLQDALRAGDPRVLELRDIPAYPAAMALERCRLQLLGGVGEHNLINDGAALDEAAVAAILDWMDLAVEMCAGIEEWNAPLASGSEATSSRQSSTSSGTRSSPKTTPTPSSPTEATRSGT